MCIVKKLLRFHDDDNIKLKPFSFPRSQNKNLIFDGVLSGSCTIRMCFHNCTRHLCVLGGGTDYSDKSPIS